MQNERPDTGRSHAPGSLRSRVYSVILFVLAPMATAAAYEPEYLRGYIEAVLDTKYTNLRVSVQRIESETQSVILTLAECIPEVRRRDIEGTLIKSQRVVSVSWVGAVDCASAASEDKTNAEPAPKSAARKVDVEALPDVTLFKPLIADPHQPQFAIRYQYYQSPVDTFNAVSVSFGGYFGIASGLLGDAGVSQIGLQGAVFSLFNLDAPSSDLVNSDFWIGLPVSYRLGRWSFLTRIYHQSSHLGDEFLLARPGINRINLSYEDWEALASYEWKDWRFYGGGGAILHSEPDLKPLHTQFGLEYEHPKIFSGLDLVAAVDWQAAEELDWRRSRSYQVGFAYDRKGREIRLMLEHFRGLSPNGQFYRERLQYTGLGLYFDF